MAERTAPVVEIESLVVRYGKAVALGGVSLRVEPGEVVALLGRNGAGKSSLVRCLLGHQKPSGGRVRLFGRDAWGHRARLMERVGVVPEEPDAPPNMTVPQLCRFCSHLHGRWDAAGIDERLERFGVPRDVAFGRLSKGQKEQVMLALALAPQPDLLVLDDPTLGLDVVAKKAVFEEVVVALADRGISVLLTSHDLPGIEGIASRVAFLSGGVLLLDEELEALKARCRRLTFTLGDGASEVDIEAILGDLEPISIQRRGRAVEALVTGFDDHTFARLRAEAALGNAAASPLSLEEVFIAFTDDGATR